MCQEENRVLRQRIEDLERQLAAAERAVVVAEELAFRDELTKLPNLRAFGAAARHEMDRQDRSREPLTVALIDVDHFKRVNDTYGHGVGDQLLRLLGELLVKYGRKTDFIGRIGGEEFAMILPLTAATKAVDVAERLRRRIETELRLALPVGEVRATISIGVAEHRAGDEFTATQKRADEALYGAKEAGRNRVVVG